MPNERANEPPAAARADLVRPASARASLGLGGAYATVSDLARQRPRAARLTLFSGQARAQQAGGQQSRFRGRGIDFDEVRAYQPGDDVRAMDWRVTARTGEPHTKLFHEERERPVLLAVDQRRGMAFGSQRCFKSVLAAEIAALCAWAALRDGNRVGGLVFGTGPAHARRPRRSQKSVLALLADVATASLAALEPAQDDPFILAETLNRLRHVAHPGTIVVIISDFAALDAPAEQAMGLLAKHCDVLCVLTYDVLETELPPPALYALTDGTTRGLLNTADENTRRAHRDRFEARLATLQGLCRRFRMGFRQIATTDDAVQGLERPIGPRSGGRRP